MRRMATALGLLAYTVIAQAQPAQPAPDPQQIPDEARQAVANALGGPFIVYRDAVLDELKASDEQRKKLLKPSSGYFQEAMQHFQQMQGLGPEERAREDQSYRRKAHEKLNALLKETLTAEQLKRLQQLTLQQEGPWALPADPVVVTELKITDEQRKKLQATVGEMQKKVQPLMEEAQSGRAQPQEIMPRIMAIRMEYSGKLEMILTDAQKKQWQELLGKPFDPVMPPGGPTGQRPGVARPVGPADPGRFHVKPGFTIDVAAEPVLSGSIVCMTLDVEGRPVVSRENGPIVILDEPDAAGKFQKATEFSGKVRNCQGLLAWDAATIYAVGQGPEGTGLYRLQDTDGDDAADEVRLIHKFRGGMEEHGPHAVVAGPDGYLYLCIGNFAGVREPPTADSPVQKLYEADLLPRYEDPSGHAAGVKAPGGTIWRLDPDGPHLTLETAGLRNVYDIAFNSLGELFTYDSDMELEEFLPWYKPVRVCHCPPGAEFGWRSGSNNWPSYYADSLPAVVDTGRGSPTGVVFYNHRQFPPEYQDAFLMADWSQGRIYAVRFLRSGATFKAETEELVTGKPLNVTDLEVAPDGSVFFSTGGRGTEGGIYRIRSDEAAPIAVAVPNPEGAAAIKAALDQPQPQSAWGREAIRRFKSLAADQWQAGLEAAAKDRDAPAVRRIRALSCLAQFGPEPSLELSRHLSRTEGAEVSAQAAVLLARLPSTDAGDDLIALLGDPSPLVARRAAEGLLRTQTQVPFDNLRPLLASRHRFVRYAGLLLLERSDPAEWRDAGIYDRDPRVATMALIALNRVGAISSDTTLANAAFARESVLLQTELSSDDLLDTLRAVELTLVNARRTPQPSSVESVGKAVLIRFPTGERSLDCEMARILAAVPAPGAIDKLLTALEGHSGTSALDVRAEAIHYARCLVAIKDGWTAAQRLRYLAWFDVSKDWNGGFSYRACIDRFLRQAFSQLTTADHLALLHEAARFPRAAARAVERIDEKSDPAYIPALEALLKSGDVSSVPRADLIAALGRTGRAEAEAVLARLDEQHPADRDAVVVALANFPNSRNWSVFVRALDSSNADTVHLAVRTLSGIDMKPDGPVPYRAAIEAGVRLGEQGGWDAVVLLRQWAGRHFGRKKGDWQPELEQWQSWYRETYPDAPAARLVGTKTPRQSWAYDQLLAFLEVDGRKGSLEQGRKVFEKGSCAKCHRFEQNGGGLGPDLTTLSSRFKRKEILESIIYPSRVIADQYKSVLVTTTTGRAIHGMKAPDDEDSLVLILSDASTLKIPKADVEEIAASKQSNMPDGLLAPFSLKEIADLFALLESGKPVALETPVAGDDGFLPLFNGKNLDGWTATRPELWRAGDGMIVGKVERGQIQANTFLATKETFSDFALKVSVRLVKGRGNSGIQFRTRILPDGRGKGYQADVANGFWGLLLEESGRGILQRPDKEAARQPGFVKLDDWNQYVITARDDHLTIELNGFKCVDLEDVKGDLSGVIAVQLHAGETMEVQFKDIAIKELK